MSKYKNDLLRYPHGGMPSFQKYYRKYQDSGFCIAKFIYAVLFKLACNKNHVELSRDCTIGEGLYIGHPFCITINSSSIIGVNVNIHKGVTIGRENRGVRKGSPIIGDSVWIGINSTVVGKVTIGDDVLIAPNTYINCDIPSHSVVFGNPCIIKHKDNATKYYINNIVEITKDITSNK